MSKQGQTGQELLPWEEIRPIVELAGYYATEKAGWRYVYRNPAHHLILIVHGRIDCNTPGGRFSAEEGDVICFRPADRNEYVGHPPISFYQSVIEFAPPPRHRATPVWDDVGPLPVKVSLGEEALAMRRQFETICIELSQPGSAHQMRVRAAVFEALAIIARVARRDGVESPVQRDPWQRIRLTMESQLANEVRVDRMAREMNLSVNHFIRRFRQHFGVTPKAYHTRFRLREGARLLREGQQSVKSVAFALGFSDSKAFARRFRQHFGVNPSDLRPAEHDTGETPAVANDLLYTVNQHVLPPHVDRDYLERYRAT